MNIKYSKPIKLLIVLGLMLSMVVLSGLAMPRSAFQTRTLQASTTAQTQSADPITLNMNLSTDPPTLDPALAGDSASNFCIEQLFLGLTDFDDETMDVVPELATSWDTSLDGQVYTFTLRSDVYWTDGHPVTAHDVEYGVKRTLDPATDSGVAYVLYIIENAYEFNTGAITDPDQVGVQAVGDYTLVFTLTHPAGYFPSIATMPMVKPQPQWAIEEHGEQWTEPGNIVTNGPYQLTEWVRGDHVIFNKNPGFYEAANVQIERIKAVMVDVSTAWDMYLNGQLDYSGLPLEEIDNIKADPVLSQQLHITPRSCTYYYGFSTDKPPFDNPLVRRAFSAAIDRQGLIDNVTGGQQPANAFAPPGIFGNVAGDPEVARWALDYEEGKTLAQQWLALAGYPNGEGFPEVTLMHNTSAGHRAIAEYIAANWTDVLSITVDIADMEWGDYLNLIYQCPSPEDKPHIWRMSWCADYPDQNNWVYENFHSEYGSNRICWYNEEFDNITSEAGAEADQARRKTLYKRAEEILCEEEAGIAPIYYSTSALMVKPYLQRFYSGLEHVYKWRIVFKVYLPIVTKSYGSSP